MYDHGEGVPQNYEEAAKWFAKAAEQGEAYAQNSLGIMYHNGQGVPRDLMEAYKWYSLAAAKGNTNGMNNRDNLLKSLPPEQITEGQRRAAQFVPLKATNR
jgi:TPR repeat protein